MALGNVEDMNLAAACSKQQPLCFPFGNAAGTNPDIQNRRGQGQCPPLFFCLAAGTLDVFPWLVLRERESLIISGLFPCTFCLFFSHTGLTI